jgi:hypothetical protein
LDDICLACENAEFKANDLPLMKADSLGPVLELQQILPRLRGKLGATPWLAAGDYTNLLQRLPIANSWFGPSDRQGLISVYKLQSDSLAWTDLILRAKRAVAQAGFTHDLGSKLTAAIGEIYGNVIDHSQKISSAYVAYSADHGRFEFVIADSGIGILKSLQSNVSYASLSDSGSALELALGEGISRYSDPGHGFGFRPLFVGLANISRIIRFRSGDHGRILSRLEDGAIQARTTQLAKIDGLFCTVSCHI